jgi:hypothetical protein
MPDVTVTHWRVVTADGGIRFSLSTREEPEYVCEERARHWLDEGCHLEVWEQTYYVGPSAWKHRRSFIKDATGTEREVEFVDG